MTTTKTEAKQIGHSKSVQTGKKTESKPAAPKATTPKKDKTTQAVDPAAEAKAEDAKPEAPVAEVQPEAPQPKPEAIAAESNAAPVAVDAKVNDSYVAPGSFGPKPEEEPKKKQSSRDFVHAHIGADRLNQMDTLQEKTGYSRTKLIQMAFDNFVAREDVAKYLK